MRSVAAARGEKGRRRRVVLYPARRGGLVVVRRGLCCQVVACARPDGGRCADLARLPHPSAVVAAGSSDHCPFAGGPG